jgi:hypothetical protein
MRSRITASDAEVAAIDQQVFAAGEVGVEVVELGDDADPGARRFRVGRNRPAGEPDVAGVRRGQSEAAAQGGRLAGAVRAEQPETGAGGHHEVDAGDDCLPA